MVFQPFWSAGHLVNLKPFNPAAGHLDTGSVLLIQHLDRQCVAHTAVAQQLFQFLLREKHETRSTK